MINPNMNSPAGDLQRVLREVTEEESHFNLKGIPDRPDCLPWMPFQVADFIAIMSEVIQEAEGTLFLDVGCGPGTKMRIASYMFGMCTTGVEIDPEMAILAAEKSGYDRVSVRMIFCGDALNYKYHRPDIIWLYRPFRDPVKERQLEQQIFAEMKSGAIIAGGAWETCPEGWIPIIDDWEIRRGAWKKP